MNQQKSVGVSTLVRTVSKLKLKQIANRLLRRFKRISPRAGLAGEQRRHPKGPAKFLEKPPSWDGENTFTFLNISGSVDQPSDWNKKGIPKLWLYNLHYFDWLMASSGFDVAPIINRWINDNPPMYGNGWEPYPISIRVVNWVKAFSQGQAADPLWLESLSVQVRALAGQLEYHLLGNHLFSNAIALCFAGAFFEGREAEAWRKQGIKILNEELHEQILEDGGHFEQSPIYHCTILEHMIDLHRLYESLDLEIPDIWIEKTRLMLNWLEIMDRGDGKVPLFNDGAYDVIHDRRTMLIYGAHLLDRITPDSQSVHWLESSGYYCWKGHKYAAIAKFGNIAAPYIAGHFHADLFSFEMTVAGMPFIVDTGTSTYEMGERRNLERSTAAHNTVSVGKQNQAEMWASFRVGRRPKVTGTHWSTKGICAEHDGYKSLSATHRRRMSFSNALVTIDDQLSGPSPGTCRFHFAPDVSVKQCSDMSWQCGPANIRFDGAQEVVLEAFEYAPSFNTTVKSTCLCVDFSTILISTISL